MKPGIQDALTGKIMPVPPLAEGRIVVVSDGRAGHVNQSLGLAAMLGVDDPEILTLRPAFSPFLARILPVAWGYDLTPMAGIGDGVVIGAGWQVSRMLRWLKRVRPRVFTIQLMRPSGRPGQYDVVALPKHDAAGVWLRPHPQVVLTAGMINRVRSGLLEREWERWKARLAHCYEPRLTVLLGGDSKHGKVSASDYNDLADSVLAWAEKHGGSLMVSASRRTPEYLCHSLKRRFENQQKVPVMWWSPYEGQRDNPYFAYLAGCVGAVVTVDSMAMLSEVATAGKPLYVWGWDRPMPRKFQKFVRLLKQQHRLAPWEGLLSLRPPAQGLMDTVMVAGFVRARYGLHADKTRI